MLILNICGCAKVILFLHPSPTLIMHPISKAKHQTVVSMLLAGESFRDIEKKTGVGKSSVGKIRIKEGLNNENIKMGRKPKLTLWDRRRLSSQFESGKLDNAVQATEYINSINTTQVTPQTVRNALKEDGMKAVAKQKRPLLKKAHRKARLNFALKYQHWTVDDWKLVLWSDETKINRIGVRWEVLGLEKGWSTTHRQAHLTNSQAWRRFYHGVGLYGLEWS